jgi:hypothetical protein
MDCAIAMGVLDSLSLYASSLDMWTFTVGSDMLLDQPAGQNENGAR